MKDENMRLRKKMAYICEVMEKNGTTCKTMQLFSYDQNNFHIIGMGKITINMARSSILKIILYTTTIQIVL